MRFILLSITALLLLGTQTSAGQSNAFRASHTHVGLVAGHFSFHGPVDLWKPRNPFNFVHNGDPAFGLLASFPITRRHLYLRGLIAYSGTDRDYGRDILISGENEFIVNDLMMFEPTLAISLRPGKHRLLPYLFTGVGLLVADPFGRTADHRDMVNPDDVKRSQLYFPLGAGLDFAVSHRVSIFGEAGWRVSKNSAFIDTKEVAPFNTSLLLVGLRLALGTAPPEPPKKIVIVKVPPLICPTCKECEECSPPEPVCCQCMVRDLDNVTFDHGSAILSTDARRRLRNNLDALLLNTNQDCVIVVEGYTDSKEPAELGDERRDNVIRYYESGGLAPHRIEPAPSRIGSVSCSKKDREKNEKGCPANQVVETLPKCAFFPICDTLPAPGFRPSRLNPRH